MHPHLWSFTWFTSKTMVLGDFQSCRGSLILGVFDVQYQAYRRPYVFKLFGRLNIIRGVLVNTIQKPVN